MKYDVAISVAGEEKDLALDLSMHLRRAGYNPYYYGLLEAHGWGEDIKELSRTVYELQSRYCIVFISSAYLSKEHTMYELEVSLRRAMWQADYILPLRLDNTVLSSLPVNDPVESHKTQNKSNSGETSHEPSRRTVKVGCRRIINSLRHRHCVFDRNVTVDLVDEGRNRRKDGLLSSRGPNEDREPADWVTFTQAISSRTPAPLISTKRMGRTSPTNPSYLLL